MPAPSHRRALLRFGPVLLLVALVAVFQAATLRKGHDWGDDFAMYILHAKNIAEGRAYGGTGYIDNPRYPLLGPQTYPPIFPLLLSPVYRGFGLNLEVMKLENVGFFAAALVLVFLAFEGIGSNGVLLGLIGVMGFNPALWELKDSITSDIPFLFFFFLALLFVSRRRRETVGRAFLTGVALYVAYGTRSVGLVLLPVLVCDDLIRRRRITRFAAIAGGVFICCAAAQGALVHSDRSYFEALGGIRVPTVVNNARYYLSWASMLWDNGYVDLGRKIVFLATLALAVVGFGARVRNGITVFELAFAGMAGIVLLWPGVQGLRFLLPLIPLYLLYLFLGTQRLASAVKARSPRRGWLVLGGLAATIYGARYSRTDLGPITEGVTTPQSLELFQYLRTQTPPDAVIVFSKPRALALFTGRRAAANHQPATDAELWSFLESIRARYFVVGPAAAEAERRDYQERFVERNRGRLDPAFSNSDFQVFSIPADSAGMPGDEP